MIVRKKLFAPTVLFFVLLTTLGYSQKEKTLDIHTKDDPAITNLMNILFDAYKFQNFQKILPYSTGDFKDFMMNIISYSNDNHMKLPPGIQEFVKNLKKNKVVGQVVSGDKAVVDMDWILLYSNKMPNPYFKIVRKEYYLVKSQSQWKILDSKNKGESYLAIH